MHLTNLAMVTGSVTRTDVQGVENDLDEEETVYNQLAVIVDQVIAKLDLKGRLKPKKESEKYRSAQHKAEKRRSNVQLALHHDPIARQIKQQTNRWLFESGN